MLVQCVATILSAYNNIIIITYLLGVPPPPQPPDPYDPTGNAKHCSEYSDLIVDKVLF